MKAITLDQLKARKLPRLLFKRLSENELYDALLCTYRRQIDSEEERHLCLWDMTHDGNDPLSNKFMLDRARCYYEKSVYTDEQWDKYIIPAINEMITYNNTFVRWFPGYLIKRKKDGALFIVEGDYAYLYGGRNYESLALYELNTSKRVTGSFAWANYYDYELVDSINIAKNFNKITAYQNKYGRY